MYTYIHLGHSDQYTLCSLVRLRSLSSKKTSLFCFYFTCFLFCFYLCVLALVVVVFFLSFRYRQPIYQRIHFAAVAPNKKEKKKHTKNVKQHTKSAQDRRENFNKWIAIERHVHFENSNYNLFPLRRNTIFYILSLQPIEMHARTHQANYEPNSMCLCCCTHTQTHLWAIWIAPFKFGECRNSYMIQRGFTSNH